MIIHIFDDKFSLAKAAADQAASTLQRTLAARGHARIIAATGASQFDFLEALTAHRDIDWPNVEMFHLDEYIGLPANHPASFRKFLRERLVAKTGIKQTHFLEVDSDPESVAAQVGSELAAAPIDVAFVGIGENGHLAFNDPPADFETEQPYLIVELDEACRRQQAGEGWFADISQVPTGAVSMSIRQILKSKEILVVVPDARKAKAVKACFEGEISPLAPASILRRHPNTNVYLIAALFALSTLAYGCFTTIANVLPADLFENNSVASVSGISNTGAGLCTIVAFLLVGVISDARRSAPVHSFDPFLIAAGLLSFLGMILVLFLLQERGPRNRYFDR